MDFFNVHFLFICRQPEVMLSKGVLRSLQKRRSSAIPKSPKCTDEITSLFANETLFEQFGQTIRKDAKNRTTFFKAAFDGLCIFVSEDIKSALFANVPESDRIYFADGTFQVSQNI